MKVLFVQKVKGIGGSENYFLRLLPKLKQSGIDCEFFLVRSLQDGDESISFIKKLKASGIYVHDRVSAPYNPLLVYYLYKVIVTSQAQIVHSHLIHADFWSALVKRFLNNQFFLLSTKHGYDENYVRKNGFKTKNIVKGFYYIIAKWSNNYIDYSTAVSNGLRRFYIDAGLVEANKIKTLYHGHDFPDNDFPDSVDYRLSPSQVIMVGRIIPLKGYQYVIEAISIASKRQPDVKLVILGTDYGFKHQLEELALNLKVRDRVIFVGFTKEVGQYLSSSDVMVIGSMAEGFGLNILEAFHYKLPVISFDVPACNEIIDHNISGILVEPFDVLQLSESIIKLLNDKQLAKNLAENGYEKLKTNFSFQRMLNDHISVYEKITTGDWLPS